MSNGSLDSDLYGDIYGDDELNDYAVPLQDENGEKASSASETKQTPGTSLSSELEDRSTNVHKTNPSPLTDGHSSLPAKPSLPSSAQLSYSAQVAKQFSAYQQTPSQERQQRKEIPLPQNPRPTADGHPAVATHEGQSSSAATDSVFGKKPSEMHDAGKMFIGGLNWDTTDEGLRDYFLQFGKVDACTIMRDPSGTSRGFAFLTFEDPAAVNTVVTREHFLDGKAIDPKRAIPREEHLRNTRYFVGGLSPATTSESMREFFSVFGKVIDATVMVDRDSGRSKGFGFVTFEDSGNSEQFVGKLGLHLDDKEIEVKVAQPRSQREQNRGMNSSSPNQEGYERESRIAPTNLPFTPQLNPMSMMFQRSMNQSPMMGGNMSMMSMNPLAMAMGANLNGYNGMGSMNAMGMMGGMNSMNTMNSLGNMGGVRLGMGPMGANGVGMTGIVNGGTAGSLNAMTMGMRRGMSGMGGLTNGFPRTANTGPGPSRMTSRGQHSFHPYSR